MAINSTTRQTTPYTTGNSFAFAFKVFTEADVKVIKIQTSNNAQTILNITSDYTVQLNGDQNDNPGGSVTLTSGTLGSGSLAGFTIVITSKVEAKQLTELTNQGGFFPEVINDALDKSVILHQQQQNVIDKTIRFQQTDSVTGLEITDSPTTRANKTISFDSSGDVSLIGPVVTTNDTGTVSTNMIGDDQVTPAKIGNADLKNLSSCQTGGSAALSDLTQAEIQILDGATVSTSELNVLQGVNNTLSASELNVLDGITASTDNLNQLTNKEVETSITANSDAKIPTSKAVNDRILTVTNALGGFVAIANKTSFPSTHPDPSENAGTVISISDADGISINNSGVASIPNGAGTGNTVTITGFATDLYNATLSAGVGMQVQTTATLHEYTYHKVLVKEQDLLNLSNDINDFGNRYRVVETTPLSNNDEGDLIFRKSDNKLLVYNGTAYQEASSVGNFYSNTLSSFNGTGGNSATFNGTAYRFNIDHPPELAEQLLVSINGVIQKPNSGTSQPSEGFVLSGSSIIFSAAPASGSDFFIITIGKTVDIGEINDGVVTNAKVASNAAIQGTKIVPSFGSQNITTSGTITSTGNEINIEGTTPTLNFTDNGGTPNNPDYRIRNNAGVFGIQDRTNGNTNRLAVLSDGTVKVYGNLDVDAGIDVTGAITSTGSITTNNNITIADSIIHQGDTDTKIRFSDANTITFETAGNQILQITPAGHLNLMQGNFYLNDSIIHAGDVDTKIRFPGLDQVSIETGGSEKLKVDANGNVLIPTDDGKLQIGNDQDLEIFHGGSGNYTNLNVIKTTNNKTLLIETASGGIAINNRFGTGATNFENMMTIVPNNAVKAYYDGVKKFETTATGTQISCGPDGDGLKLQGTTNRIDIVANTNRAGAANTILELDAHWNNTPVAFIALGTGDDTTNKDDGRLRFFTKPSGGTITERLKIEPNGSVQIPADGIKLQLGASQDLALYHQHTTSSYGGLSVIESHSMPLAFKTNRNGATEDGMVIYPNNRVELMYDNSKKFQTTSTGVLVGDHTIANVNTLSKGVLDLGAQYSNTDGTPKLFLYNDNNAYLGFGISSNQLDVCLSSSSYDFVTYQGTTELFRVEGTGNVQIPADDKKLQIGANQDLEIFKDGNHVRIKDNQSANGYATVINSDHFRINNLANTENLARFIVNGAGQLFYDHSKKLETTTDGVDTFSRVRCLGGTPSFQLNSDATGSNINTRVMFGLATGANQFISGATTNDVVLNVPQKYFIGHATNEYMATFDPDGAVTLYHDAVKKLQTTSYGAIIDPDTSHTNTSASPARLSLGGSFSNTDAITTKPKLTLWENDANTDAMGLSISANLLYVHLSKTDYDFAIKAAGNTILQIDSGQNETNFSTNHDLNINASTNKSGVIRFNTYAPTAAGPNKIILWENANWSGGFGVSVDHIDYYSGAHHCFYTSTTTSSPGEIGLEILKNNAVELYYDGSRKLVTSSTGIDVTGKIKATQNIEINADNMEFRVGANGEFRISHTGSDNILRSDDDITFRNMANNETIADFKVNDSVNLYYDNSVKLQTTSTGIKGSGTQNVFGSGGDLTTHTGSRQRLAIIGNSSDGSMLHIRGGSPAIFFDQSGGNTPKIYQDNNNLEFYAGTPASEGINVLLLQPSGNIQIPNDNAKLQLGASQDLELFHDGSVSRIRDVGTGGLFITTDSFNIKDPTGEDILKGASNGAVELYYDNSKKFETTSYGNKITAANAEPHHTSAFSRAALNISGQFGGGLAIDDLGNGGVTHFLSGAGVVYNISMASAGGTPEKAIEINRNGNVELYYDNSKKLETTSTGVALSGNLELSGAGGNVNTNWDDASWEKIAFDGSYNVNPQGPNKILLQDFSNWKAGFGVSNNLVSMYSGLDIAFYGLTTDSTASTKELLAKFKSNNAAELYYDNVKRLETTSTGATVTTTSAANSIKNITTSTSAPSGGSDGDLWFTYIA